MEQQETKNAVAEQEAKRRVIGAQAEGEEIRAKGFADADVMKAQGYSKKDEFQRDVQQSFAESLGKAGGANSGSSIASDIASFGMAAGAVNSMMPQFYNSMQGFGGQWGQNQPAPGARDKMPPLLVIRRRPKLRQLPPMRPRVRLSRMLVKVAALRRRWPGNRILLPLKSRSQKVRRRTRKKILLPSKSRHRLLSAQIAAQSSLQGQSFVLNVVLRL